MPGRKRENRNDTTDEKPTNTIYRMAIEVRETDLDRFSKKYYTTEVQIRFFES